MKEMGGVCSMPIEGAFLTKVVVVDPPSRGAVIPTKPHNDPNNRRIYVKYKNQVSEVEVSIQNRVFVKGSVVGAWVLANGTVFRIEGDEYGAHVTHQGELRSGKMACQADRMTSSISSLMCSICIATASGAAVTGLWMIACVACLIATVVPASFNYMHAAIAKYVTGEL
jgi:hypothetical protein